MVFYSEVSSLHTPFAVENIKEIALKLFSLDEKKKCICNAKHEVCLQCSKCRATLKDQIVFDYQNISQCIDHTLLRADASQDDIYRLCMEANIYNFKSVCVNPYFISFAKKNVKSAEICTVIGFPLGANTTEVKIYETQKAIELGATEIDMVVSNYSIKKVAFCMVSQHKKRVAGSINEILYEISKIAELCSIQNIPLKVIIETCLLTKEHIIIASLISKKAGADFVKTSTGFSTKGAEISDVLLIRDVVGLKMGVKASGGIKTKADAISMLRAGANRLGTSNSVGILDIANIK